MFFFLCDYVEATAPADRYILLVRLPAATTALLNEQMHYHCSHGIGIELTHSTILFSGSCTFYVPLPSLEKIFLWRRRKLKL
jgi:hypothetical protein